MEHSEGWSGIVQFLWKSIFRQESPQNPPFIHGKVGQGFCNICGIKFANKNTFKTHVFNHGGYYKLISDSAILVGKHGQARIN